MIHIPPGPSVSVSSERSFLFLYFLSELWPLFQSRSSSDSQPADENLQADDVLHQSPDQGVSFTEVHAELAPEGGREEGEWRVEEVEVGTEFQVEEEYEKEVGKGKAEEASVVEQDLSLVSEGVSEEYALSSTVVHEEEEEEVKEVEEEVGGQQDLKEFLQQ